MANGQRLRYAKLIGGVAVLAAIGLAPSVFGQDRNDRMTRIEPGTVIAVRTNETIDVDRRDNRFYSGVVDQEIRGDNGRLAIPRGTPVQLAVRAEADNDLVIDLDSLTVNGQRYGLRADANRQESQKDVVGSIVGAIQGGEVRGRAVRVPRDSVLSFRLEQPLEVVAAGGGGYRDRGGQGNGDAGRVTRIEPGTVIAVRTNDAIESDRRDSRVYYGTVDQEVRGDNGRLAIPRGAPVEMIVRTSPDNDLILDLESVTLNGQRFAIRADASRIESQRDNSLVGQIVGAIQGEEVRGRQIRVPGDSVLTFRIDRPLDMGVVDRGEQRNGYHYHPWYDHK